MPVAAVVGGGIGGLAAAVALVQAGVDCTVYEREAGPRPAGAGLSLWSNAVNAMTLLGLREQLLAVSAPIDRIRTLDLTGGTLACLETTDWERRFGSPVLGAHRADVQRLLLNALGTERVRYGRRLTRFDQDSEGVSCSFDAGDPVRTDFLVGADGIHSAVRRALHPGIEARRSPWVAWRGVSSAGRIRTEPRSEVVVVGAGAHFGWLPVAGDRVYWFGCADAGTTLAGFAGWPQPVAALIAATAPESVIFGELMDLPQASWGRGRTTLLGDAGHAMLPGQGQGACQALEDAAVLGRCVASEKDPARALRAYERARARRVARVQSLSHTATEVFQWRRRAATLIRRLSLGLPSELLMNAQGWLYSGPSR